MEYSHAKNFIRFVATDWFKIDPRYNTNSYEASPLSDRISSVYNIDETKVNKVYTCGIAIGAYFFWKLIVILYT